MKYKYIINTTIIVSISDLNLISQVCLSVNAFYIIDDNNLYSLYIVYLHVHVRYAFYIIDHNKHTPVKIHTCESQ